MKNYVLIAVVVLVALGGVVYYFKSSQKTATEVAQVYMTPEPQTDNSLSVTYSGKLPCADCEGIEEDITLTKTSAEATSGDYTMKDTYLGKSVQPFESKGKWTTLKGTAKNPNATVYQLTSDSNDISYYMAGADQSTIKQLDNQKNEIDSPFNQTLTRLSE